jgi:DNA topoisomerase I
MPSLRAKPAIAVDASAVDPARAASAAGLRHVTDGIPGLVREPREDGFVYRSADGAEVKDDPTLQRIRALAIPPAWTDVWICADPRGHLQASGRDARGRKQYRYHPQWSAVRGDGKFDRVVAFAAALPRLRRTLRRHLRASGFPREKVLAIVVSVLSETLIRVGNPEYARSNRSYGLTTLRNRHVAFVRGGRARFRFRGKGGLEHDVVLDDARLVQLLRRCQQLPGQALFQYRDDDGNVVPVDSGEVNAYLREVTGEDFTAKDFRTWAGTLLAVAALSEAAAFTTQRQAKSNVLRAIDRVAEQLNNTRAVCRKYYVHPAVFETYLAGTTADALKNGTREAAKSALEDEEASVVRLLKHHLKNSVNGKQ